MSDREDNTIYKVVINHELQYSIWAEHRDCPLGWADMGVTGKKDVCLDHIERVWCDMRPAGVRFHMERIERDKRDQNEENIQANLKKEIPLSEDVTSGYKVTDREGFGFYTKDEKFKLEVGKTIEVDDFDQRATYGGGLHFSLHPEDSVANGIAAAVWDDRYFEEIKGDFFSSKQLHQDGIRIFEVEVSDVVPVTDSISKARKLTVKREIPLDESRLWKLIVAYVEWEEAEKDREPEEQEQESPEEATVSV